MKDLFDNIILAHSLISNFKNTISEHGIKERLLEKKYEDKLYTDNCEVLTIDYVKDKYIGRKFEEAFGDINDCSVSRKIVITKFPRRFIVSVADALFNNFRVSLQNTIEFSVGVRNYGNDKEGDDYDLMNKIFNDIKIFIKDLETV